MSAQKVLRWVIAVPCAFGVGVAIAFVSGQFGDKDLDFVQFFRRAAQADEKTEGDGHSGGSPVAGSSSMAFPDLTQGTTVHEERQPTREEFAALLEQEKSKAARELLTSYILTQEALPKAKQTSSERSPDHPLVEELINKPNARRSVTGTSLLPGTYYGGSLNLGSYPQDVLREAAQAFNSPQYAPLRANTQAAADLTLGQVSALMDLQDDVRSRLESGSGGSLGNILGLGNGGGLNLSGGTRRAIGNMVANALGGSGSNSYGAGNASPFMGNSMTPAVGSATAPVGQVDPSELAAVAALVTEYRRVLPDLTEAEMKEYLRRVDTEGKIAAMQWVVRTKGAGR